MANRVSNFFLSLEMHDAVAAFLFLIMLLTLLAFWQDRSMRKTATSMQRIVENLEKEIQRLSHEIDELKKRLREL